MPHACLPSFSLSPLPRALHRGFLALSLAAAGFSQAQNATTLSPIVVKNANSNASSDLPQPYAGNQIARGAHIGMLGALESLDTPFSATAYTEETIRNSQATDITDVLSKADASVYAPTKRGIMETFMVRGFSIWGMHDLAVNGLAGMAPIARTSTEMFERIELQKGPSAALKGMTPDGSVGGDINLVTKRAGNTPLRRLTASYASDSLFGIHADVGQRFGEQNQFGIRVNAVARDGDTAVNGQQHKLNLGALALDWRGERVRWSLDAYRQRERIDGVNYVGIMAMGPGVTRMPRTFDGKQNMAPPWSFHINTTNAVMARVELDITDTMTAWAASGYRSASYNALIGFNSLLADNGQFMAMPIRQYYDETLASSAAGLSDTFTTGAVTHNVSVAASLFDEKWGVNRNPTAPPVMTNLFALNYGAAPNYPNFATSLARPTKTTLRGLAIADRMTLLDERVQLTLGARRQQVKLAPVAPAVPYNESAWSPTFAVLVKPLEDVSVYANYIQGLSSGGTAPATAANAFQALPPMKTEQAEIGFKVDWGRLTTTTALFNIKRPSAQTDPNTNIYAASGDQRNRGLEINIAGEVSSNLRLLGGISWIEATLRKQANPANNGKQAIGVPKLMVRMGAEYDVPDVTGLTLTGNVNYTGSYYPTVDNRFSARSYTTADLGLRYQTRLSGHDVALRASVNNLFNQKYWGHNTLGSVPGAPRSVMVSASVDF